jgi:uncharacterized phage protein gp47/JayE
MTVTLDDLLAPDEEDDVLTFFLTQLAAEGFPVTDWETGGVGYTLARVDARSMADALQTVRAIAKGGLVGLAEGAWFTLLAASHYGLTRNAAVFAEAKVRLTRSVAGGPTVIAAGQLWITTTDGRRYNNTTGGTLGAVVNDTLDLTFKAESPGIDYNLVLSPPTPLAFVTPLVGVAVAVQETAASSGTCMSVAGTNEETDAQLRQRCLTRWATLGAEKTRDAYVYLARNAARASGEAITAITKVLVDDTNPDGPGTVRIYLAGAAGGTGGADLSDANTYLQDRKGLCAVLAVQGATNDTVTITATVKCKAANVTAAKVALQAALQAYKEGLEIGDGAVSNPAGVVLLSQVVEILMSPEGVVAVPMGTLTLAAVFADYTPAKGHIAVPHWTIGDVGGGDTIQFQAV